MNSRTLYTKVFPITLAVLTLLMMIWVGSRPAIFGSPDEAANFILTRQATTTGSFRIPTGVSAQALAVLHPRSLVVQGSDLLSASFLGLLQVGVIANKVAGVGADLMITPLLAGLALFALQRSWRKFWGDGWAWLGVALVGTHPAMIEFWTLPMFHNGAAVAGYCIAGWALLRQFEKPSVGRALLCGAAYGLAIFFRPVDILWTGPLIAIVLITQPRGWRWLGLAMLSGLAIQIPWLIENHALYGSWLASGYQPLGFTDESGVGGTLGNVGQRLFVPLGGVWNWHWLSASWWYLVLLMPLYSVLSLSAIVLYFRRKFVIWQKIVKLGAVSLIGLFPLVYYGSWDLYPNTPAANVGALASYDRYWLLFFVAMSAGVIVALRQFHWPKPVIITVAMLMIIGNIAVAIIHPVSGFMARQESLTRGLALRQQVLGRTEANAVIIAGSADKYLYGHRLAAHDVPRTSAEWQTLVTITDQRPVYILAQPKEYRRDDVVAAASAGGVALGQTITIASGELWPVTRQP